MGQSQLQAILEDILGSRNVYFQPPESVVMQYPCIVYGRDGSSKIFADNTGYRYKWRWQVTLIDRDPENPALETLALRPLCSYSRSFVADGLNHDVFELYH